MTNVIRPTFGAKRSPEPNANPPRIESYGTANGWTVALLRGDHDPSGPALKVVIGLDDGERIETVATMPDTPDGELMCEMVALGVLRALEVIEIASTGPGVA